MSNTVGDAAQLLARDLERVLAEVRDVAASTVVTDALSGTARRVYAAS